MQTQRVVHVVSAHAEGEVGDVIVGGVSPPPGETLWDQRNWIAKDNTLRNFMLNEPRGGVFRHVNLLVPPKHPEADAAFIIMEPEDTPPMSGSNAICVSTVLLETGILPITGAETHFNLEAPGGLVSVKAQVSAGKVTHVSIQNVPSFACQLSVPIDVPDVGRLTVDTAFGGDSFVVVDAAAVGIELLPENARAIAQLGVQITKAADTAFEFEHPGNPEWRHHSFCLFTSPVRRDGNSLHAQSVVAIRPGKLDRSPTGTALSARLALLHARGEIGVDDTLICRSIIGSTFSGRIVGETQIGETKAIRPEITGRAWITGTHQHMLDPSDPWPEGYRLSDTWPQLL